MYEEDYECDECEMQEYSMDEAIEIIGALVERKTCEIAKLEKSLKRLKKAETIEAKQALIDYLKADLNGYRSVLADMTDDPSLSEGIDMNADPVPMPECYQAYIDSLPIDDLENEMEAEEIRADYCDQAIVELCTVIGKKALKNKKMVKALLDDPYALNQIGEVIFSDDYLFDLFTTLAQEKEEKKKKKKEQKGL